jgi:hypothetical protein
MPIASAAIVTAADRDRIHDSTSHRPVQDHRIDRVTARVRASIPVTARDRAIARLPASAAADARVVARDAGPMLVTGAVDAADKSRHQNFRMADTGVISR